jgi:hypothetical protein
MHSAGGANKKKLSPPTLPVYPAGRQILDAICVGPSYPFFGTPNFRPGQTSWSEALGKFDRSRIPSENTIY